MTNQRLGEAQERGQRTAHQQRNSTERGYRRCYNTKTCVSTPWRNKPTSNVHQSQPGLRIGLNHEFRRRQGRAVGGVVAGQCRTVINALNRIERGIEDIYKRFESSHMHLAVDETTLRGRSCCSALVAIGGQ